MRQLPDFTLTHQFDPFGEYLRQQAIDPSFRAQWLAKIGKVAEKIRAIDTTDFEYARKLFNTYSYKESGKINTSAAKFENELDNLGKIIDWLEQKYLEDEKFKFNLKTMLLSYGKAPIADYSVGKRRNSNAAKLLKKLYENKTRKVSQAEISIDTKTVKRAVDQAMYQINKTAGCELVEKNTKRYSNTSEYYLNPDLI